MQIVSYILSGDDVTEEIFKQFHDHCESLDAEYKPRVEYILFFSKTPSLVSKSSSVVLVHTSTKMLPVGKAIATASGEILVFTTVNNVLADTDSRLLKQTLPISLATLMVPFRVNTFDKIVGLRRLVNVPYLLAGKRYATSCAELFVNPKAVIGHADKQLALERSAPTSILFPDYLIKKYTFVRPYKAMLYHQWHVFVLGMHEKHRARVAQKLRQRVEPVVYSPDIPVFIICRDRVEPLKKLVKWCEDEGLTNIILIDNASTYPPLLEYLASSTNEVIRLRANAGHTAPWDEGIVEVYAKGRPFIVTDPDVIPSPKAHGAIKLFCRLLNDHPERTKVGFGLRIDDIPDSYALKDYVLAWEKPYWVSLVEQDVYDAEIDTTFALYRQNTPYTIGPGLRTGGKYVAKHESWYVDSSNITDELRYYRDHADKRIGSWGVDNADVSQTYVQNKQKILLPRQ